MRPAFVFLLCSIFPCSFEGRQWNNDINSWTELNGLLLEGGLVAWGNPDYGGTPNEPIGYAGSESDRLSQYVDRTTALLFFFFLFPPSPLHLPSSYHPRSRIDCFGQRQRGYGHISPGAYLHRTRRVSLRKMKSSPNSLPPSPRPPTACSPTGMHLLR